MRTDLALHYHVREYDDRGVAVDDEDNVYRTQRAAFTAAGEDVRLLAALGHSVSGQNGHYVVTTDDERQTFKVVPCFERPCLQTVPVGERWWVEDPETGDLHMPGWEPPVRVRARRGTGRGGRVKALRFVGKAQEFSTDRVRRMELSAPGLTQALAMFRNVLKRAAGDFVLQVVSERRAGVETVVWTAQE